MSVPSLDIADAVVTVLNAADLSLDFTAERKYTPKFDLHSSAAVQVAVVPKSDARNMQTRGVDGATIQIDIGVMKKLQNAIADEATECDALLELCEEIKPLVNRERLSGVEDSVCIGIQQEPIYSVEEVDEKRTFLTVLTATFKTTVAP